MATGAVIGAWTAWQARKLRFEEPATDGMIDWSRARSIAHSMNRGHALTLPQRARLDMEYRELVQRTIPLVSSYTGDQLPGSTERVYAFDRIDWIDANIAAFQSLFEPIERLGGGGGFLSGRAAVVWNGLNQKVLSAEIGFLLGYLARRVLGQYDLALLGREPIETTGKLYFVHENIAGVERMLGVPPDQFRLWLALHETTHAFEFEAHPWVRQHMNEMLKRYISMLTDDVEYMKRGVEAVQMFWDRARNSSPNGGSWIELVMSAEQRELFNQMQATMSIIEGYSNHVMNAVGHKLMPDYNLIRARFEQRQLQRTPAEQLFARITGLDLKMEQYRSGEAFVDAVVAQRGHEFAHRVWDRPENLPTLDELKNPASWIARIDASPDSAEESA